MVDDEEKDPDCPPCKRCGGVTVRFGLATNRKRRFYCKACQKCFGFESADWPREPKDESKPIGSPSRLPKVAMSGMLLDIRHVASKPGEKDRTDGQRALRKTMEENPERFNRMRQDEERSHAEKEKVRQRLVRDEREAKKEKRVEEVPVEVEKEVDGGTERALDLIQRLRDEWGNGNDRS